MKENVSLAQRNIS